MKNTMTSPTPRKNRKKKSIAALKKSSMQFEDMEHDVFDDADQFDVPESGSPVSRRSMFIVVALIVLGLIGYRYRGFLMPARVNGQPILVTSYLKGLHQTYGREYLDTLTTQKAIEQEISKSGVSVANSEIDNEIDRIDQEASASGGIAAILEAQGTSMDELRTQVRIQLAVKQILKDKIAVSDQEVNEAYAKNRDFFKGRTEADAKASMRQQLEAQKFQTEAQTWLTELKGRTKIEILL